MLAFHRRPLYLGFSGASCGSHCGKQRSFLCLTPRVENLSFSQMRVCFNGKIFDAFFTLKKLHNNAKLCYSHLDQLNCPRCSNESGN